MDFVVKCHLKFHCRNIYINIYCIYIYIPVVSQKAVAEVSNIRELYEM